MPARLFLKTPDYLAAFVPVTATVSLGACNQVIAAISGILGIAYLVWKWRREARRATTPPFPLTKNEKK